VPDSSLLVRTCTAADWPTVQRVDELAFGYTLDDDPSAADEAALLEMERTHLATLDGVPAGVTSAYTMRMSVPGGGELPYAGVTWVGVVPTMRRRGVLRALMSAQLADVHQRAEPIAALFASEPGIYGRFGYGSSTQQVTLTVRRGATDLDAPMDASLSARIVAAPDAADLVAQVYDEARARRAGAPVRPKHWWERCIDDPPSRRDGASELRALVVGDDGGARAYALFSTKGEWPTGSAEGVIDVREVAALDAAAAGLLWRTLLDTDLVTSVSIRRLPTDDVLLHLLRDPRRPRPEVRDGMYLRLVDLPVALLARSYVGSWSGVVDVLDTLCPWNAGRWRLTLGPGDAAAERTDDEPDVSLDVRELGGAFLGGGSLVARAAAGMVAEHTSGAVAGLSAALRYEPAPFCPFGF
jgi:predicted acetyltransferase